MLSVSLLASPWHHFSCFPETDSCKICCIVFLKICMCLAPEWFPKASEATPFVLFFRICSAGSFFEGSLARFGSQLILFWWFWILLGSIMASETLGFGIRIYRKHKQTTADTRRRTNSCLLVLERSLAVANFDQTTITKTKPKNLQCCNGDARNDNDGAHPTPAPPKGINSVSGIAQRKQFVLRCVSIHCGLLLLLLGHALRCYL